jgi:hypothetical protein
MPIDEKRKGTAEAKRGKYIEKERKLLGRH